MVYLAKGICHGNQVILLGLLLFVESDMKSAQLLYYVLYIILHHVLYYDCVIFTRLFQRTYYYSDVLKRRQHVL